MIDFQAGGKQHGGQQRQNQNTHHATIVRCGGSRLSSWLACCGTREIESAR